MSTRIHERKARDLRLSAPVFAALGDETRLALLAKMSMRPSSSISELTSGTRLTRQAITKHLRVLQGAGLVRSERRGRENRFAIQKRALLDARRRLEEISRLWDDALLRLRDHVEE